MYYFLTKICRETNHRVYIYEKLTTYERGLKNKEGWATVKWIH